MDPAERRAGDDGGSQGREIRHREAAQRWSRAGQMANRPREGHHRRGER
jgi:hypothetical protein